MVSEKPYIPLSELRKVWKSAVGDWMNFAPRATDLFRSRVHDEVQRKRIANLEAELTRLRAELAEVIALNKRNADDAVRAINAEKCGMQLAVASVTEWGKREQYIKKLEAQLAEAQQQPNADGLLPCPWCGIYPRVVKLGTGDRFSYSFYCPNSDCMATNGKFFELDKAIAAWNRRATMQQPAMPEPDWAQAEPWAMYWAVDSNGTARFHQYEPVWSEVAGLWRSSGMDAGTPLIDPRTTLRKRPSGATP